MMDMMDNMKNEEKPEESGNGQGESNRQNHIDDMHQSNNKE
jgi:hypothetical protein